MNLSICLPESESEQRTCMSLLELDSDISVSAMWTFLPHALANSELICDECKAK